MAQFVSITTPDGVVHEAACVITGRLVIEHGMKVRTVTAMGSDKKAVQINEREFKFEATVQAFHDRATAESGAKSLDMPTITVTNKTALEYFQSAATTLFDLKLAEGKSQEIQDFCKTVKLADVVDAAVWVSVLGKYPEMFSKASTAPLGDCMFTNPSKSRKVTW